VRLYTADALSAVRFVLAAAWIVLYAAGAEARSAYAALAAAAAVSDFIDGPVARRFGVAAGAGGWLDPVADVAFVLAALGCEAARGAIPVYIPVLIALSFGQYAIDSLVMRSAVGGPIRSRLGHWGGVINYALVLALAFAPASGAAAAMIRAAAPAIAAFYVAAIIDRALRYRRRDAAARRGNERSNVGR
jgi:cardiolipin synthase (CMP-forming)